MNVICALLSSSLAELLEGDDADEPADGGDVGVVDPQHREQRVNLQQAALLDQLQVKLIHLKLLMVLELC